VVKDDIDFYAHCVIKWGIKLGFWKKMGSSNAIGKTDITFRDCGADPSAKVSHDWWIWKTNQKMKKVGDLRGKDRNAEIGDVIPADSIVYRMRTGTYDFHFPGFE
jgi:hypothetical protein